MKPWTKEEYEALTPEQRERLAARRAIQAEIEAAQAAEREAFRRLHRFQQDCPHDAVNRFEPDASGNNDDSYICIICDGEH